VAIAALSRLSFRCPFRKRTKSCAPGENAHQKQTACGKQTETIILHILVNGKSLILDPDTGFPGDPGKFLMLTSSRRWTGMQDGGPASAGEKSSTATAPLTSRPTRTSL
jgi:hypothetical protein